MGMLKTRKGHNVSIYVHLGSSQTFAEPEAMNDATLTISDDHDVLIQVALGPFPTLVLADELENLAAKMRKEWLAAAMKGAYL